MFLAANNIKAYIFDSLRPTPELSFAVRVLGCTAGIVVTASHNPKNIMGLKFIGKMEHNIIDIADGIQIKLNQINDFKSIPSMEIEKKNRKKELLYF